MKDGFSLIEVMIALLIILISLASIVKIYMVCLHSSSYADNLTYATTLANSKLNVLEMVYIDG